MILSSGFSSFVPFPRLQKSYRDIQPHIRRDKIHCSSQTCPETIIITILRRTFVAVLCYQFRNGATGGVPWVSDGFPIRNKTHSSVVWKHYGFVWSSMQ
ncbi:hypothetical protein NPIL_197161 [Nephila pilipes]|uniref:Uncharacterized protein n=1 Tax=Nephila pilipes TaxID=299642 RepID=A0A8X6QES6_NEPPI|nr:hypothetical protein NPIL_197161 [Nephila pilipes]